MWNAACAVVGSTIDGRSMSGDPSRAARTASSSDSVPPEVTDPTNPAGASSSRPAQPTRSFSIVSSDGNAVGSSPLDAANIASASSPTASASPSPES